MKLIKCLNLSISIFSRKIKSRIWVLGFVSLVFFASVFSYVGTSFLYSAMLERSNRLPDIRDFEKEDRLNLVNDFIDRKFNFTDKYILVLGDSQSYGYRMLEEQTFSHIIEKSINGRRVVNLSVVDGRAKDAITILKQLQRKNIKLVTIIYNFNARHYRTVAIEGFSRLPEAESNNNIPLRSLKLLKKYWGEFLVHEIIGWKKSEHMILDKRFFSGESEAAELASIPKRNVKYFLELLSLIKKTSNNHLIVLSPFSERVMKLQGINIDSIVKLVSYFKNVLKENGMNYKDLTLNLDDDDFLDYVHLSEKGHQRVAGILKENMGASRHLP